MIKLSGQPLVLPQVKRITQTKQQTYKQVFCLGPLLKPEDGPLPWNFGLKDLEPLNVSETLRWLQTIAIAYAVKHNRVYSTSFPPGSSQVEKPRN